MTTDHTGTNATPALARVEALAKSNPKVHISTSGSWLEDDTHHHLEKGRG